MAKQTWTLEGRITFRPQFAETRDVYGSEVALPGVRVQVSAKETKLDPTWNEWADVFVNAEGRFRCKVEKDKTPRYFRVRVMFKDDHLKLYPPSTGLLSQLTEAVTGCKIVTDLAEDALEMVLGQTTRLAYDVKWNTVVLDKDKSDRRGPGIVDFKDLCFESGGKHDLGDRTARRHADIWWLAKRMMSQLRSIGCGFVEKRPPAVIHPFQNPLIGDRVEASYTNVQTDVIHLIENSRSDHFNAESLAHELMHALIFQHSTGEKGLAWQLLVHGTTHDGRQDKRWVAFHEALAEWSSNLLYSEIYERPATVDAGSGNETVDNRARPFSRRFLRDQGIKTLSDLDHYEIGWIGIFTALVSRDLELLDPDDPGIWARFPGSSMWSAGSLRGTGDTPGLADVLGALQAHPAQGYPKQIGSAEMTRVDFLKRMLATSSSMNEARRDRINTLLNPSPSHTPVRKPAQAPKVKARV